MRGHFLLGKSKDERQYSVPVAGLKEEEVMLQRSSTTLMSAVLSSSMTGPQCGDWDCALITIRVSKTGGGVFCQELETRARDTQGINSFQVILLYIHALGHGDGYFINQDLLPEGIACRWRGKYFLPLELNEANSKYKKMNSVKTVYINIEGKVSGSTLIISTNIIQPYQGT